MSISDQVRSKRINILVTNICNLSCGGCSQQCGYIPKEKLWNISLDQLEWNIKLLLDVRGEENVKSLGIFGGEPTLHPEYSKMLSMFRQFPRTHFQIYTNGIRSQEHLGWNHSYYLSLKRDDMKFRSTSIAPQDLLKVSGREFYWSKARRECPMWLVACSLIYNNRAYFCEPAAAWDIMTGEDHGWPLVWGEDPFDVTDMEVEAQALNFCYRCGWCLSDEELRKHGIRGQRVGDTTLVSEINLPLNHKKVKSVKQRRLF